MRLGRVTAVWTATLLATLCAPVAAAQIVISPHLEATGTVIVWGADAGGASGNAPVVADWIINSGTGASAAASGDHDLISGDVFTVVTGSLVPTTDGISNSVGAPFRVQAPTTSGTFSVDTNANGATDQNDAFSPFGLRASTDVDTTNDLTLRSSFYVASNTAYAVDVQAAPNAGTTAAQFNNMRVTLTNTVSSNDGLAYGASAQISHTGGGANGPQLNNRRLSTLAAPARAYTGTRRTARVPGSIADQSIRFNLVYTYNLGTFDLSQGLFDIGATVTYTVFVP